jgi:hypothetical protein
VRAWTEARALWQEAADKQYEEMFTTVAPTAERQIIVLNERAMFYAQAAVREAELKLLYPDDPETVARELAELMMNHVVDLCYAIHTAPEARVDSYLGSHETLNCAPAAVCGIEILDGTVGSVRYSEQLCDEHNSTRDTVLKLIDGAKTDDEQLSAWKQAQKLWQIELNAATNKVYKAASREDRAVITSDRKTFDNWLHTYEDLLNMLYPEGYAAAETISKALMDRTLDFCGLAD